jgi:hypothetical protein
MIRNNITNLTHKHNNLILMFLSSLGKITLGTVEEDFIHSIKKRFDEKLQMHTLITICLFEPKCFMFSVDWVQ